MEINGFIRCNLTLGDIKMSAELVVVQFRGPDKMTSDNAIPGAFHGVLDWEDECILFKATEKSIAATHQR